MAELRISLPDTLLEWVEAQIGPDGYRDSSDVVRSLIDEARERQGKIAAMQTLINEGRASGLSNATFASVRESVLKDLADK